MRRAAVMALAALLAAASLTARADPAADLAGDSGSSYRIRIPHGKKDAIETAIGDGSDTQAMRAALANPPAAPPPTTPGVAAPDTRAAAAAGLSMVRVVEDTRALARRKVAEAERARTQADQDRLLGEAQALAASAGAMSNRLAGRSPANTGQTPDPAGCGMLRDCRLAQQLSQLGQAGGRNGFDSGFVDPKGGVVADPNRGGGSPLFQGSPGMAAVQASLDDAQRKARQERDAGHPAQASAIAGRLERWREQVRLVEQMRGIAKAKRAEAEHASNPALAAVLKREADVQDSSADQLLRRMSADMPTAPVRQPGGIKFNNKNAEGAALALNVTAVEFDPIHGRLVLVGSRSSQGFDLDVFADVLRLAVEKQEPFFSLNPRSPEDWDTQLGRMARALNRRFGGPREIAKRIRAVAGPPIHHRGLDYYYAPISRLDPSAAADAGHDDAQDLVFSPDWLRYTKLGWMLYRADLAIKAVASGFREHDDLSPSVAWSFPDFDPIWTHTTRGAGRADFELDHVEVAATATRIDVADVRPRLYVTGRRSGTFEDTEPSGYDRELTAHFTRHWPEYVQREPELANLEMIYRAYVAARYLVRQHPALASRILAMPRASDTNLPPLTVTRSPVLRVAFRSGQLTTLDAAGRVVYDISGGFGGGTELRAFDGSDPHVTIRPGAGGRSDRAFAWLDRDRGVQPWREAGDNRAAFLDLVGETVPARWIALSLAAAAATVLTLGGGVALVRALPWQRLARAEVCARCISQRRWIGGWVLAADCTSAAALLFFLALPVLAAVHEQPVSAAALWPIAVIAAGIIGGFVLLGFGWRLGGVLLVRGAPVRRPSAPDFLLGSRLAILTLSAAVVAYELSGAGLGGLAERVVAELGSAEAPKLALVVGSGAALCAFAAELFAPFALGARLLARLRARPSSHAHGEVTFT